jgi:membrane protein involved in colicin uptake
LDARLGQKTAQDVAAAVADADAAHDDAFAGGHGAVAPERGGGNERGQRNQAAGGHTGALKEAATIEGFHARETCCDIIRRAG